MFDKLKKSSKEQNLFYTKVFCNYVKVFTVTFDHL